MIRLENITKAFPLNDEEVIALKGVDLTIKEGSFIAIMGPSGSGKSTLMNILGCLDRPTSGRYFLDDVDVSRMDDDSLSEARGKKLGFIFQSYNLLSQLTVVENIQLPLVYQDVSLKSQHDYTMELVEQVGLSDRIDHKPTQLSGGQQQRVAIARALINRPLMVLADEPTGNLDSQTEKEIMEVLSALHKDGKTVVVVTHDEAVAKYAEYVIRMKDGVIVKTEKNDIGAKAEPKTEKGAL